jgi:uncharacterized protein (TIGR02996 family)
MRLQRGAGDAEGSGLMVFDLDDDEDLMLAVLDHPADESFRLIYADWLEERGHPDRATWIRLESTLLTLPQQDSRYQGLLDQWLDLADQIEPRWQRLFCRLELKDLPDVCPQCRAKVDPTKAECVGTCETMDVIVENWGRSVDDAEQLGGIWLTVQCRRCELRLTAYVRGVAQASEFAARVKQGIQDPIIWA